MTTVCDAFLASARRWGARPFLNVLPETAAIYQIPAGEIGYALAAERIAALQDGYRRAGWGSGHRVGLLLENRPDFIFHWFALNGLSAGIVPINPDLRSAELQYLVAHSEMQAAIAIPARVGALRDAGCKAVAAPDEPPPAAPFPGGPPGDADSECALLYTSGSTGLPKGCIASQTYFLECGRFYAGLGGLCGIRPGAERMLTPLPLFHMNAIACSTMAMLLTGGCLTVLDRFHASTWWRNVAESRATIVHYLGVMPAMLMQAVPSAEERSHAVRFGFGAGIDRRLHAEAEARFGFPFVEAWAMTESGAGGQVVAHREPRHVGTACFGRAPAEMEVRIAREDGGGAADDEPGELLIRRRGPDARYGFFLSYLKDAAATEKGWRGGWWHTGDIVRRDAAGNLYFVDRRKNVIRRSGENISALEVEQVLQLHPAVRAVAVAAVPDALRGDEVMACIVPRAVPEDAAALAAELVAWCLQQLAYYKAPGWVGFVEALPLTSTNKLQRGELRDLARRWQAGAVDTRGLKKRA